MLPAPTSLVRPRLAARGALIALAVSVLAACSPASSSPDSSSAAGSRPAFVVARISDMNGLDPQVATDFQTLDTLGLVYDRLVATNSSGKIVPDLATSWTISPDGRVITFTLRSAVRWQDGDLFTSADVKASLQRILNQATGAAARSNLTVISSIDIRGPHEVALDLSEPPTELLYSLATVNASILHTKDIAAGTVAKAPDGTGPFRWESWSQGQQVTLTANTSYFGGAPKISTLEFRVIPSEASILAGLRAGAFQLGLISDPSVAAQATGASQFSLIKEPSLAYHVLMLNGSRGALRNQRVREAISCAINRQQLIDTASNGDGTATGPITSPDYSYSSTAGLPCTPGDTAAARALLRQAGYPHGLTLRTIVPNGQWATASAEAQSLQSQLAEIGVNLQLQELSAGPYDDAWIAGQFDAAVSLNSGYYDPYLMYGRYFTVGGSLAIPAGLVSPTLSRLLNDANAASDEQTRHSLFQQLQQQLLVESPWVWTFRGDDYYLVAKSVRGFKPRPDGALTALATASS
jgi:peptide/nickel transport system substrate-binding protein